MSMWTVLMGVLAANIGYLSVMLWTKPESFPMPFPSPFRVADPAVLPNPSPLGGEGPYQPNDALRRATRLFEGRVRGSESVAVSPDGTLYMLDKYGWVLRAVQDGDGQYQLESTPVGYVGPGRPLGFEIDADGSLLVCNSLQGLMRYGLASRRLEVLANVVGEDSPLEPLTRINYANDLDVASDGTVYFTDSTAIPPALNREGYYDTMRSFLLAMYQGNATGRLLAYDPRTHATRVLANRFWYSNGVALSSDEASLLVVETCTMSVHRHWLKGPKAGSTELWLDRLPGFPDGITRAPDGSFWVSLVVPEQPWLQHVLPSRPLRLLASWLKVAARQWGFVVQVSPEGRVLRVLQDPDGRHVSHVSAATQHGGRLFLGNLAKDYVSYLDL